MYFTKEVRYLLYSTFFFTLMQTCIKLMPAFDSFQHIFSRSIIGLILSVAYLKINKISLTGHNSKLLFVRGIVGAISMFGFFYILTQIPFATAVAIKYLSPIFASLFALFLLKEKILPIQWLAFLACFVGIVLIKGFDFRISLFDLFVGILSSIFGGLLFVVIRKIGDDDHPIVILQYFMLTCVLISIPLCFPNWTPAPTFMQLGGLFLIGIVGFFAQHFFTISIQVSSEVSSLANLRYIEAVYALIIGYFVFGETYNTLSFIGLMLLFIGLFTTIIFKNKKKPQVI